MGIDYFKHFFYYLYYLSGFYSVLFSLYLTQQIFIRDAILLHQTIKHLNELQTMKSLVQIIILFFCRLFTVRNSNCDNVIIFHYLLIDANQSENIYCR